MQAQRIITRVDATGHLISLPLLPPGQTVEVIMLMHVPDSVSGRLRKAPDALRGKIRENGDVFSSASDQDWGLS
jgi:hypothetical protein